MANLQEKRPGGDGAPGWWGGGIVCITLHLSHAAGYYTDRRRCGTCTAQLGVSRALRAPRALCVAQDRKNPPALSIMEYI